MLSISIGVGCLLMMVVVIRAATTPVWNMGIVPQTRRCVIVRKIGMSGVPTVWKPGAAPSRECRGEHCCGCGVLERDGGHEAGGGVAVPQLTLVVGEAMGIRPFGGAGFELEDALGGAM